MGHLVTVHGIDEVMAGLQNLRSDKKKMQKDLKKILRAVLAGARKMVSRDARTALPNDPRRAYTAVRHSVYKRLLGGQVNILARRRANSRMSTYHPQRTLRPGQRGGNRRPRSERTDKIDSYYGTDRGFILRFQNAGTEGRHTKYGYRGSIRASNWFPGASQKALEKAAGEFAQLVERAIAEVWEDTELTDNAE